MATLYFACSGVDFAGTEVESELSMQSIMKKFDGCDTMYSETPTVRDFQKNSSQDADFAHVVLKIEENETNGTFTEPGFYWVLDLSPEQCKSLLGGG